MSAYEGGDVDDEGVDVDEMVIRSVMICCRTGIKQGGYTMESAMQGLRRRTERTYAFIKRFAFSDKDGIAFDEIRIQGL